MSSWQAVNSPDDSEKKKLRDAVDNLQNAYMTLESQNRLLKHKLGDQESFVELSISAKEAEAKTKIRESQKASVAAPSRSVQRGDPRQDLLSRVSTFHANSATNLVLTQAGAPLFDTMKLMHLWIHGH